MQRGVVFFDTAKIYIDLPSPDEEVLPGVAWGALDAFPSPAYWAYQAFARRICGDTPKYKLGKTLREELGACLLGGHGIPSAVGLAAFRKLQQKGAFEQPTPHEEKIAAWLSEPIEFNRRLIHYRFARQKARYLASSLARLDREIPPMSTGRELRDWLLACPGVGYKTASWVARNWLDADDVAILDIHVYRAGILGGFFEKGKKVDKDYLELESRFLEFSAALDVRPSELDALIWLEMMSSKEAVHQLLEKDGVESKTLGFTNRRPKRSQTNSCQLALRV